ncbi:MAG: alpha/beta hydrolase family protein, partial [Cyanobacteriota bacterium]
RGLVVISHGLWDGPESFEGWAQHLASHGYTVVLPVHPGSDSTQQQAMLSGKVPPPTPAELRYRPLDVSAVLDAAGQGRIAGLGRVAADRVVVMGHSWGATTALQLAGATPSSLQLRERCRKLDDPDRNLSWVLQCSFLDSADRAGLADRRVIAVAAVSPPLNLLFDQRAGRAMTARGLIITGSRDWVVPPDPEAISRFEETEDNGHNLVVVRGGDHFNMRGPLQNGGGPLRALLLAWADAAFTAGAAVTPSPHTPALLTAQQGWGDTAMPMVLLSR